MGKLEDFANIQIRKQNILKSMDKILKPAEAEHRDLSSAEKLSLKRLEADLAQAEVEEIEVNGNPLDLERRYGSGGGSEHNERGGSVSRVERGMFKNTDNYRYAAQGASLRDAYNRYLLYGANALSPGEYRALQADDDKAGGFLKAPVEVANRFIQGLDNLVIVRRLATVFKLKSAMSLRGAALDTDLGDPTWTSELSSGNEDTDMDFDARTLTPRPIARRIKVSNDLLRMEGLNPDAITTQRMEAKIAAVMENAFLQGTGANQPLGVFVASDNGISTSRDSSTYNSPTSVTADGLIQSVGQLKAPYRRGAVWIMSRQMETKIRFLKTGDGVHIWQPSLSAGNPAMLLGFPVYISEYAPSTFTASQYVAIIGDFSYYWIADALDVMIQRLSELYAETNQTGYICRASCDGMPVLQDAFVRVKLAAS